ncbi:hypothetical protein HPB52_015162 [Rhipicephalus sanguineus]|uniref:PiggyBac transposable element-derived protein domain-containing protein n=1 Tax=Rhipicephalus sanguineus TaxID=34632 RepID=A0A9D4SZ54_RHISA|nr:hypothetical protein HPB52_015162 [Rhipicephalus sanguineus]
MGGVDMADRMISYYRMKARVSKWTIRCFFHLMDMALSNSWLQYTRDMRDQQKRPREVLEFLDFRVSVAAALVNEAFRIASDSDSGSGSQLPTKRAPLPPLPVRKTFGHFPRLADIPNAARCRMEASMPWPAERGEEDEGKERLDPPIARDKLVVVRGISTYRTPPSSKISSIVPVVTPVHRASRTIRGHAPEFGLLPDNMTAPAIPTDSKPTASMPWPAERGEEDELKERLDLVCHSRLVVPLFLPLQRLKR